MLDSVQNESMLKTTLNQIFKKKSEVYSESSRTSKMELFAKILLNC